MAVKKAVASLSAEAKAPVETKVEAPKAAEVKKEEVKKAAAPKKAAAKPAAKKEEKKAAAPKAAAPKKAAKPVAPKAAAPAAKKSAAAVAVTLQFDEKEYTQEDLAKIANDVWVYDYNKKASELKDVKLFVKPQESKVYYVFNGDITGDFDI